jgi:hypothetical protein
MAVRAKQGSITPQLVFLVICISVFFLSLVSVPVSGISLNEQSIQSTAALVCPGEAPLLGNGTSAGCWRGYWLINGTVELNDTRYNIEGRIHVWGNFTLLPGSSLSWKGFPKSEDSHPEFQTTGEFILSHVNATGEVEVEGDIFVDVSSDNLKGIIGEANEDQPKRKVSQPILESPNAVTITLIPTNGASDACRKVSVGTESRTTENGRSSLSAVFEIDDTECGKKKSNAGKIAAIVAPSVVGGLVLVVVLVVVLSYKFRSVKAIFRPYHKRKIATRDSVVTRETISRSTRAPDLESGHSQGSQTELLPPLSHGSDIEVSDYSKEDASD